MGSMSASNEAKAAALAGAIGEALLDRPEVEAVHTAVMDLGTQIGLSVRLGGRDLVFRLVLPTKIHADGRFEVTL